MTLLLLGGTTEARRLASRLVADGLSTVTSLAGGVEQPRLPAGEIRIGGFGGVHGLADYLRTHRITAVVDATHPFAAQMTANAATACAMTRTPLLRLSRPGWADHPDARSWYWTTDLDMARATADQLGVRPFLATGRQAVPAFLAWDDHYVLLRVVDPPDGEVPATWEVLRARGPFTMNDELALLRDRRIDVLVTKDSGGSATQSKLDAAALLGIPVVIVRRPADPAGVPVATTVDEAYAWAILQTGFGGQATR
jgi:precorrin-6A/cobalt-precorrin-6A reductase